VTCQEVIDEYERIQRWQRREKRLRPVLLRWSPVLYIASATVAAVTGWWPLYWLCVVLTATATIGDIWLCHHLDRSREQFAIDYMEHMAGHAVDLQDEWIEHRLLAAVKRSKAHPLPN
jgi:hypothetical protein